MTQKYSWLAYGGSEHPDNIRKPWFIAWHTWFRISRHPAFQLDIYTQRYWRWVRIGIG